MYSRVLRGIHKAVYFRLCYAQRFYPAYLPIYASILSNNQSKNDKLYSFLTKIYRKICVCAIFVVYLRRILKK